MNACCRCGRDVGQRHVLPLLVEAEPARPVGGVEPRVADAARELVHRPGLLPGPPREHDSQQQAGDDHHLGSSVLRREPLPSAPNHPRSVAFRRVGRGKRRLLRRRRWTAGPAVPTSPASRVVPWVCSRSCLTDDIGPGSFPGPRIGPHGGGTGRRPRPAPRACLRGRGLHAPRPVRHPGAGRRQRGPDDRAPLRHVGDRHHRHGPHGQARRRLLHVRQRGLGGAHGHPRRSLDVRHGRRAA